MCRQQERCCNSQWEPTIQCHRRVIASTISTIGRIKQVVLVTSSRNSQLAKVIRNRKVFSSWMGQAMTSLFLSEISAYQAATRDKLWWMMKSHLSMSPPLENNLRRRTSSLVIQNNRIWWESLVRVECVKPLTETESTGDQLTSEHLELHRSRIGGWWFRHLTKWDHRLQWSSD